MKKKLNRRDFLATTAAGGLYLGLADRSGSISENKRVGIIGLDTSHSVAFTKAFNTAESNSDFGGYRITAAYPRGSNDIKSSVERIPGYTEEVKKLGVEITASIGELISRVDFVMLETNDGRLHLEQALEVMKAGKTLFIDKPMAASLADVISIFRASGYYNVPLFSSSSLRYLSEIEDVNKGKIGKVIGATTYSPATLEQTHPDLFWYGIHGVESLFAVMGTGCKSVTRIYTADTDVVVGIWNDQRIGTFRGTRSGRSGFGGTVFGESGNINLGDYQGYNSLLKRIVEFFNSGIPPVKEAETKEIFAFMSAAEESRKNGGKAVELAEVLSKAEKEAMSF